MSPEEERQAALDTYRSKLIESREWEAKLKNLRLEIKGLQKEFDRTEENIKALQSVGQIIGEVLKQLDEERCKHLTPVLTATAPSSIDAVKSAPKCTQKSNANSTAINSHCQGLVRPALCCRLSIKGR